MENPKSFSYGLDNFLRIMLPYGAPLGERQFPSKFNPNGMRIKEGDTPKSWFIRCLSGSSIPVENTKIEENIGGFATIEWEGKNLVEASIQLIVSDEPLDIIAATPDTRTEYFRFDFHPLALGKLFREPMPHVHISASDEPRMALDALPTGNGLMDFFDFIYRTYHYPSWEKWARRTWEGGATPQEREQGVFDSMLKAFESGNLSILETTHLKSLRRLKQTLRAARNRLYPVKIRKETTLAVSYNS